MADCGKAILNELVPVHVVVFLHEHTAVRAVRLAAIRFTCIDRDAHVGQVIFGVEGEQDAIGTCGIFTTAVALLVAVGIFAFEDFSRYMMPIDVMNRGWEVRNRISVVGHSPAGLEAILQPRGEGTIAYARRTEGGQLDTRRGGVGGVEERQVSGGVCGQGTAQRVASAANRFAGGARLQCRSNISTSLGLHVLVGAIEAWKINGGSVMR